MGNWSREKRADERAKTAARKRTWRLKREREASDAKDADDDEVTAF